MSSSDSDIRGRMRPATSWREDSHKDPEELEREIDETRADVRATIDVLEQRLSPEHLLDLTIGRVREHGGAFAGNLGSAARDNPVPLLLTSIGIAWMMLSGRNGNGGSRTAGPSIRERWHGAKERWRETGEDIGDTLHDARDRTREGVEQSRDTVAHAAESLREGASRAASATREQFSRARSGVDYLMHDQPLVLGAIGLAAGALIGATLPGSAAEDRMMGEARDRALGKAKESGRESYRKARERAHELAEQAKQRLAEDESAVNGAPPGRGYGLPEDASVAVQRSATDSRKRASKSKPSKSDPESVGENPTEPQSRKRPSEGGVGEKHSSKGFTGEKSPTSKAPPD
jgi:hypothetical protein